MTADYPRPVTDKTGHKRPNHVYVMRQPNGLTSALVSLPNEGFSDKCDYVDMGPSPWPLKGTRGRRKRKPRLLKQ